ncbi:nonribosomal peptide synthetase [Fusarium mundagurra]|uniref:Nonribosomal peptide synthetase n=1 Tax=Fusarium mundagurra TaxID=1567541 RepID=A0A8H5Z6L0_9HYPO|nr:nonribosomal peptide synthetase [Fusarium mundagurra]
MANANYFTCTLGEAARLKRKDDKAKTWTTVVELIDDQAERNPDAPALGFATFTHLKSTQDTSKHAAGILSTHLPKQPKSLKIGLLSSSSTEFVLTWLGLMRMGYTVLLLAPQLAPSAVQHLCETLDIRHVFVDDVYEYRARGLSDDIEIIRIPSYKDDSPTDSLEQTPGVSETAYICHTSGTSSGLPKPIPQTQFGVMGALYSFPGKSKPATFSTTPLYHGGFPDCLRAWTSGASIWFFPEGQAPITGANIIRAIEFARGHSPIPIKYFSSVPYVLQMLSEEYGGIEVLQTMDLVGVGGAALPPAIGDKLVDEGVHLLSRMGSAECGFLMSSHRDYAKDRDWQFLRAIDDPKLIEFEPRENGLSELVVKPGWPFLIKTNREDGSYATSDLFEPHSSIPNAWRYHSRADAQITLANGKKFDPSPIEGSILASSKLLQDVLIFGSGRDYAGALLFPSSSDTSADEVIDSVWPHIDKLNSDSQTHTRINKTMLVVVPVEEGQKPLEKSSKGTILRRQAEEKYSDEIEGAYSNTSSSTKVPQEGLQKAVHDCFEKVLGRQVESDQDLYRQGVDSISCIQIRKLLEQTCLSSEDGHLPLNVIYDQGTVDSLVEYLERANSGDNELSFDSDESELNLMQALAKKYSNFDLASHDPPNMFGSGASASSSGVKTQAQQNREALDEKKRLAQMAMKMVQDHNHRPTRVVLTGATGFLGAHILHLLRDDPKVDRIYCLLRADGPFAAQKRVSEALFQRFLPPLESHQDKVVCLPCDLTQRDLGLFEEQLREISTSATKIIHSAWAVNFSLRLNSFEDQILSTKNLINLAIEADAQFIFVSSIAAVSDSTAQPIPEMLSQDPKEASPLGYSRSKWVAEHICDAANKKHESSPASVVRVGQLCSNETGVWNTTEAYPLLLSTSKITGCLPDLLNEVLNWLPVEQAAQAVVEIAFTNSQGPETPVYHVLNPHTTPSWKDMLDWLATSNEGPEFEIVSSSEWLERLEKALSDDSASHPSQALLGLWKRSYAKDKENGSASEGHESSPFDVAQAQKVSASIRDVKPLTRERLIKTWNLGLDCHYSAKKQMGRPAKRRQALAAALPSPAVQDDTPFLSLLSPQSMIENLGQFDLNACVDSSFMPDLSSDILSGLQLELGKVADCSCPVQERSSSYPATPALDSSASNAASVTTAPSIPQTSSRSCSCLATFYLAVDDLCKNERLSFPSGLPFLRKTISTARQIAHCQICPASHLSAMQNIQLLGTLLMSVGQQYGVILESIDKEANASTEKSELKRLQFSEVGVEYSTEAPSYNLELRPAEWAELAKKAVKAEVYGNGREEDCLWSVLNYLEKRQTQWHAVPPHQDCPHQYHQSEEEPFCIKILHKAKESIEALKWKCRELYDPDKPDVDILSKMPHLVSSHCIEPHFLRNVLDALIIGTGTAGVSAALSLGRARRSAIVFDIDDHRDRLQETTSQAISKSIQDETIAEIKTKFKTIMFSHATAASIRENGMVFEAEDATGRCWKGRKVILAMSSHDVLPDIPGYEEAWGKHIFDVSKCLDVGKRATADAAVLITSDSPSSIEAAVLSAHLARQFSPHITFLTNGLSHVERHPQILGTKNSGFRIENRPIKSLESSETSVAVQFADGAESVYGLIAHKPRKVISGPFAEQLDLEMTSEGRILVDNEFQETSTRGVFAVGDSASFLKESTGASAGWLAGVGANLQIAEDDMSM